LLHDLLVKTICLLIDDILSFVIKYVKRDRRCFPRKLGASNAKLIIGWKNARKNNVDVDINTTVMNDNLDADLGYTLVYF
jgi:hypothetical protein